MRIGAVFIAIAFMVGVGGAKAAPQLFASDDVIDITIKGPINGLVATAPKKIETYPATLTSGSETHAIELSPRGNARRNPVNCDFPPLRLKFVQKPAIGSLFEKQGKLKLVTHCKKTPSYQQFYLLEYGAYNMYRVLTPISHKVRLALVHYVDSKSGKEVVARTGFFIEDLDDVADRNDLKELDLKQVTIAQHDPQAAARSVLFYHMIANHDWSMTLGETGEACCHNGKLLGTTKSATSDIVYLPYDFDYSGFVGATYAVPPDNVPVSSVKKRYYRGSCSLNAAVADQARIFRAKQPEMYAALAATPGLQPASLKKAQKFLDGFFKDIADDGAVEKNILKKCR
jgi:hypothetical protein